MFFSIKEVSLCGKTVFMYSCRCFYLLFLWLHENYNVKMFYKPPAIFNCMFFIIRSFSFQVSDIMCASTSPVYRDRHG